MIFDLHSHTTCSDGTLSPTELVNLAVEAGVDVLAVTDHDSIAAWQQLERCTAQSLQVIPAVEFSSQWQKIGVHILGLNVDIHSEALQAGVRFQQHARRLRAERIAEKLQQAGFHDALAGATAVAGNDNLGRPHFAQYLVNIGAVNNFKQAFKKYLGAGKPGDIKQCWADIPQIVAWIRDAGGTAVLAHPVKYDLTRTKLVALVDDFIAAGGQGMEVVSGKQMPNTTRDLAIICQQKQLLASCGSDFHQPGQPWAELGRFPALPEQCQPVWQHW